MRIAAIGILISVYFAAATSTGTVVLCEYFIRKVSCPALPLAQKHIANT